MIVYSRTSNKGPSKKGTLCLQMTLLWVPKTTIPYGFQEPPRRGQPPCKGQNSRIYIVPKVSFVQRFHCNVNYTNHKGGRSDDKTPSSAHPLFLGGAPLYQKTVAYSQLPLGERNVNSTAQVANQTALAMSTKATSLVILYMVILNESIA